MRLAIIGTSHISPHSVIEIKKTIRERQPEAVAIELDSARFNGLFQPQRKIGIGMITQIGIPGFLFALVGAYIQKKLAKHIKMNPGDDMRAAAITAKEEGAEIYLIDQPIQITLKRVSQEFTWREKFRVGGDILKALFFGKKELEKRGLEDFDLKRVPSKIIIKKLIHELKGRYPSLYKVLIEERNIYMVNKLKKIAEKHSGTVIAVIGAGHEEGMIELLQKNKKGE